MTPLAIKRLKNWPLPCLQFKCCGVDNYTNWQANTHVVKVPESCCEGRSEECLSKPESEKDLLVGCFTKLDTYVADNSKRVLWVAIAVVIVMVR